jgi:UPF0755 protein
MLTAVLSVITPRRSELPGPRHARDPRRRHWGLAVFLVIVLVIGVAVFGVMNYLGSCKSGEGPHDRVRVTIPEGTSANEVVDILHEAGVLKCGGFVGKALMRNEDRAGSIRAGTYALTTNMTIDQVLDVVTKKPPVVVKKELPIPEGYRITQIAERVHEKFPSIPAKQFVKRAMNGPYALPPFLPKDAPGPEGFLFPATYLVPVDGVTADAIIRDMIERFDQSAGALPWGNAKKLGVNLYEIVTIASMIEKEAGINEDRPLISAVIYNRLEAGMQLGIDATLLYDDPTPDDGELTADDLESDSPYNTRVHTGLPPTPIASPGDASLEAALSPAKVDYLYYVACEKDGPGKSRFSSSHNEFLHDKSECLGG